MEPGCTIEPPCEFSLASIEEVDHIRGVSIIAIVAMEATASDRRARAVGRRAPAQAKNHTEAAMLGVLDSVYHFLYYVPCHRPRTPGGKLALLALAFHTVVMSASYQAALAGFLYTSYPLPVNVPDFGTVERSSLPPPPPGRVCMLQASQGLFPMLDSSQVRAVCVNADIKVHKYSCPAMNSHEQTLQLRFCDRAREW